MALHGLLKLLPFNCRVLSSRYTFPFLYKYKHSLTVEQFRRRKTGEAENEKYNKREQLLCRHTVTEGVGGNSISMVQIAWE